jgi:hypothetical protein
LSGLVPSIVQRQIYVLVKALLVTVTGLDPSLVIQGLPNRTAMPLASPGFATMQITWGKRLNTNIDTWDVTAPADPDDPPPTTSNSETHWMVRVQLDFYGSTSGDWATVLAGLWRDEYVCEALAGVGGLAAPTCQPLYHDEPLLAPLEDDEKQYEQRWTLPAYVQYNPVTTVPQDFATALDVTLINVDKAYPP